MKINPKIHTFGHLHSNSDIINYGSRTIANVDTIFYNSSMVEDNNLIQAEGFFPSENRWLFYRRFYTNAPKKGDILAIHGAFEHSGRYEILGS